MDLLKQLEAWNEADEFTKCISTIEAIPEEKRGYELTYFLVRAYENYAIIGDHAQGTPIREGDVALKKALELLMSIQAKGRNDPRWHMRAAYAHQYIEQEEQAIPYARRWAELDPEDEKAGMVIRECQQELAKKAQCRTAKDCRSVHNCCH